MGKMMKDGSGEKDGGGPSLRTSFAMLLASGILALAACGQSPAVTPVEAKSTPKSWKSSLSSPENPVVIIHTTMGDVTCELLPKSAPKTVANFLGLAEGTREFIDPADGKPVKRRYYDGGLFFRVIPEFMVQTGDPTNTGGGGPGYSFEDELSATALGLDSQPAPMDGRIIEKIAKRKIQEKYGIRDQASYQAAVDKVGAEAIDKAFQAIGNEIAARAQKMTARQLFAEEGYAYQDTLPSFPVTAGVLAMANAGPNTNGSQFFITEVDYPSLTGRHTVFGRVLSGLDVVRKITHVARNGERPVEDVVLTSIERLQ